MPNTKYYLVFDCETCTMDFVDALAGGNADKKKKMAIARPLIYDMGWTICDRKGTIYKRQQYLVAETFSVPSVFNTAYYKEKRPIYLEMIKNGLIQVLPWSQCVSELIQDMENVSAVGAFNSIFDFKKAIPFTELYMKHLYDPDFYTWQEGQKKLCQSIAEDSPYKKNEEQEAFEGDTFSFRGNKYDLFDLWGLSVEHLLNNGRYKDACLANNMLTASGTYFKSSAESTYRYLKKMYQFDEAHTALQDAEIETYILNKIAQRHATIKNGIEFFPFKKLGTTDEYVMSKKPPKTSECKIVYDAIANYMKDKGQTTEFTGYLNQLASKLEELANYIQEGADEE